MMMFSVLATRRRGCLATVAAVSAIGLGGLAASGDALSAQDKYTVQVPNGLSLSDIRGYEKWAVIAVSQPDGYLKAILGNLTMIEAYQAGIPANGKPFPDGSKAVKIIWTAKKSAEAPFAVNVPDTLQKVEFMEKDARKFPDSGGWGYAPFSYDAASGAFSPIANDAKCGAACHSIVKAKDFVFTGYAKR
jgi:hypothetical protein